MRCCLTQHRSNEIMHVEVWNRYEQSRLALHPFLSSKDAAKRYSLNG
jgi:hypothetical protein